MNEFNYEIIQTYGIVDTSKKGWTTEVNLIKWGSNAPKIDLRAWSPDHQKMSKGITFSKGQLSKLIQILSQAANS